MSSHKKTIAASVEDPTPDGIADAIGRQVSSGDLEPGTKLPTVRDLATALAVSPSTVGEAWQILRRHRVIETDGRRGTFVRDRSGGPQIRYWQVPVRDDAIAFDLSRGTPDAALLPNPLEMMETLDWPRVSTSYLEAPVVPELLELLDELWPFTPERVTVLNGAMDAMDRIVEAAVGVGDLVGVSDPGFPPLFDLVETAGATIVPIDVDEHGMTPESVKAAVASGISTLFIQPRGHNPTGCSLTPERRDQLASILSGSDVLVVEDDHSGMVSGTPLHSLGSLLPGGVAHIHSFSKSHGPDLRLAALGGPADLLIAVEQRRSLGPAWSSRLLQRVLAAMLSSPTVTAGVEQAAVTYQERRSALVSDLRRHGLEVHDGSGLNIWVPVNDEATAVPMLIANGIGVARGRPFQIRTGFDHIRVTTSAFNNTNRQIGSAIAEASRGQRWPQPENNGGIR